MISVAASISTWADVAQAAMTGSRVGFASEVAVSIQAQTQVESGGRRPSDDYWGASRTAERILQHAKRLAKGDPSKLKDLQDAVERGFAEAERILGTLPEVSRQTLELIRKGFDTLTKHQPKGQLRAVASVNSTRAGATVGLDVRI